MPNESKPNPFKGSTFNIVHHRSDPTRAVTLSGHEVHKQEYVYFKMPVDQGRLRAGQIVAIKCADYHGSHFVYIDPLYNVDGPEGRGHWFAMCTCGSPAVIIGPDITGVHDVKERENLLVCHRYMQTMTECGHGFHMNEGDRHWT